MSKFMNMYIKMLRKARDGWMEKAYQLKEELAQTLENADVNYETLRLHDEEEIAMRDSKIAELTDLVNQLDFFYEGNGFYKRGLSNSIQIGNYIEKLEKDLSELTITNNYQRVISDKNEQISILEMKIEGLESLVNILKHCNNCKHHHVSGCDFEDSKECNWQTKSKWELCE